MNPVQAQSLRNLLEAQQVAALGTLHDGEPYVSMVPYALLSGGRGFVVHVSGLAAHTRDMLAHPAVSLLVVAPREPGEPVQGLARATIQGRAAQVPEADPRHAEARSAYLARFPQSEPMFGLADFSVFVVEPRSVDISKAAARESAAAARVRCTRGHLARSTRKFPAAHCDAWSEARALGGSPRTGNGRRFGSFCAVGRPSSASGPPRDRRSVGLRR